MYQHKTWEFYFTICALSTMTISSWTKCVTLIPRGSGINLSLVSKATTRVMHWGKAAERCFKIFIDLFFYNTCCPNYKLIKGIWFSISIEHNCSNTIINYVFTLKRFASFRSFADQTLIKLMPDYAIMIQIKVAWLLLCMLLRSCD